MTVQLTYPEIHSVHIQGPGTVTTGGGFVGGGFGFAGAVEGIALAGILNALTTKTKVHTFIDFVTDSGELFLHYGLLEPAALRIALSPVFVYLRRLDPNYIADRTRRLQALRERNVVDDREFRRLLGRLMTLDDLSQPPDEATDG